MRVVALAAAMFGAVSLQPLAAAPRRAAPTGCAAEIGQRRAGELLGECRQVAEVPGTCRADLACEALRATIRRDCEEAGADAPPFCELHADPDDEEDE